MADPELLFVTVAEARAITTGSVDRVSAERVNLDGSLGRVLANAIVSGENIPGFDNSAMDGYAFRCADAAAGPTQLLLVGEIPCGVEPTDTVSTGQCIRIMTGAAIPVGADTVIQQELVKLDGESIVFTSSPPMGANIRLAGSNVRQGQEVLKQGDVVTAGAIGMLASLGHSTVSVTRRPKVAVFSSGDELVGVDQKPGPAQVRNSNGPALSAQVVATGGEVVHVGTLRDNEESIIQAVNQVFATHPPDVVVVSGGASVGDYDLVRQVLEEMGMRVPFWKVRQRPGKPFAFGLMDQVPVFMLPGNPVSASVCFEQYVRPCIRKMLGMPTYGPELVAARLEGSVRKNADLYYFVRGVARVDATGTLRVHEAGPQGSHVSQSLVAANCLMHLPEDRETPAVDSIVEIEWLKW